MGKNDSEGKNCVMNVFFRGADFDGNPALREYAEKRVSRLAKYFSAIKLAEVSEKRERNWRIVEIALEGDGHRLRGRERADDLKLALDNAVDKLEQQLKRLKERMRDRKYAEGREAPPGEEGREFSEEYPQRRIVKVKTFEFLAMSPQEALQQMELLDHSFFVFQNEATGSVNVLYRREDGNCGLIQPES
jgi:putative sigma-54 modulation protein